MNRKLARGIIRFRIPILIGMVILTALSVGGISRTRINYDLNRYLAEDTMTRRALTVMQDEFSSSEQLRIVFQDQTEEALSGMVSRLNGLPEVLLAARDDRENDREENGVRYQMVSLTMNDFDAAAFIPALRTMFPEAGEYWVGGSAASSLDVQRSVGEEMPLVMGISIAVVLAVLLATSHAWLEPALILLVLGAGIVINLGTNFVFPDISFITFAVSAILQLALSIDYAIMLIHTWNDFRDEGLSPAEAMEKALSQCFLRIFSSALTTVAGLLSLLVMSFTIGFDIGLALSKGILISMVCVFLLTPGMALLMEKMLNKTRHRPLRLPGEKLAALIWRIRRPLACVMLLAILGGLILQSGNSYIFYAGSSSGRVTDSQKIAALYGESNPLVLLIPTGDTDEDYEVQRRLVRRLQALTLEDGSPAVGNVSSMVTTGEAAVTYYTPEDLTAWVNMPAPMIALFFQARGFGESVRGDTLISAVTEIYPDNELLLGLQEQLETARTAFKGRNYDRMLLELNLPVTDIRIFQLMDRVLNEIRAEYGENYYVTGTHMSAYDIGNAFQSDLLKVNLITFLAIFLIVALSFRSMTLPLLLVFVIEGAIWITMGCSRLMHQPIFFISYLICVSIQMGATIDYAILLTDQYRHQRAAGQKVPEALGAAMKKALPTVLTSGVILTAAGYLIGRRCTVFYIADIGALLARGTVFSVLLVLTLLPALLSLADRFTAGLPAKGFSGEKTENKE